VVPFGEGLGSGLGFRRSFFFREYPMADPLYGLTAKAGLHVLKSRWGQKQYLREQCAYLAKHLDEAINSTWIPPVRKQSYFPDHELREDVDNPEAKWERALWRRWKEAGAPPVPEGWAWIAYYQIPLFPAHGTPHYRAIDLLGIERDGTLTVIELKKDPDRRPDGRYERSDSPLKMVLEAAAYAEVIRKNWDKFHRDLMARLENMNTAISCPDTADRIRLVGVAPQAYWSQWVPLSDQGLTVSPEAWSAFRDVLVEFGRRQCPVSFVSIGGSFQSWRRLTARHLKGFPLG